MRLQPVFSLGQLHPAYRGTPIARMIAFHNLGHPPPPRYDAAELLVCICMDRRAQLRLPRGFAYTIRTAAGSLRDTEFRSAYAIAVGGVRTIALVGHTDCGMVHLTQRRRAFADGLVRNAGWSEADALAYFDHAAPRFEIDDEVDFILAEARRVRALFPAVLVAPLILRIETNMLCQVADDRDG